MLCVDNSDLLSTQIMPYYAVELPYNVTSHERSKSVVVARTTINRS